MPGQLGQQVLHIALDDIGMMLGAAALGGLLRPRQFVEGLFFEADTEGAHRFVAEFGH